MLIIPDKCETCGMGSFPTELMCDKCQTVYTIDEFNGVALRFASRNECVDCEKDEDCDNCEIDSDVLEFQFCDMRCLSEFICDPTTNDRLSQYDSSAVALFLDPESARNLFYAIGSYDW